MSDAPSLPTARYLRFESYREYEDRFDALIPKALSVIRIFERRLTARYNSRERCDLLRAFLRGDPTRRVLVVVHEAEPLVRDCPRLLKLAVDHHPRLQIRRTLAAARHVHDPAIVVDFGHYLHRFHHAGMRAAQGLDDLAGAQQLIDRYGELWEASAPVSPGRPAGL
jgi:hypothetical protein